jgi:sortase A
MVKRRTAFRAASVATELAATLGVVLLLLVGYQAWGRINQVHDHQNALAHQLSQSWDNPSVGASATPTPAPTVTATPTDANIAEGAAIGRLYVPKLGLDWVVVQGISLQDIQWAPGHYPGTALPGVVGNFSVAGHREQGLFWDLDQIQPGDFLIVQTAANWYVYQVFQNQIVAPTAVEVVAPTPNEPGVAPTAADITLTTCNPKWDNYQRMVVHGTLVATTPADQKPAQLTG